MTMDILKNPNFWVFIKELKTAWCNSTLGSKVKEKIQQGAGSKYHVEIEYLAKCKGQKANVNKDNTQDIDQNVVMCYFWWHTDTSEPWYNEEEREGRRKGRKQLL